MTCSTCNNSYVKRCEISQRCGIWSGHHHIWSAALAGVKTMIITKNGSNETTLVYDILYINRTSFLCRFRIWNQNSNIPSVASGIACFVCINSANDQFSHSRCSNRYNCYNCGQEAVLYVQIMDQKVYIKSPVIGFHRNPLVTHADFDHISPICGKYHDQYHHATHLTHHIWWV